ncbi:MAG: c-type cytochrome [bacterium]
MRTLILAALLSLLLATPSAGAQERLRPLKEKVRSGHTLFNLRGCSNCHSIQGAGGAKVGPDLARITVWASPILGAAVMWNHIPLMSKAIKKRGLKWPKFKGEEIGDIFTYLHSLNQKKGSSYSFLGNASSGEVLFESIGCVNCHGKPFAGGKYGPDLAKSAKRIKTELAFATRMIRHAPYMIKKGKKEKIHWPRVTGNQIASIFAYLKSLRLANLR